MKSKNEMWVKTFENWKQSGLSRKEFCQKVKIPVSTFDYWRRRVLKESAESKRESKLVKLPVALNQRNQQTFLLEFPSGHKLHIPQDCPGENIHQLLSSIGEIF